MNVNETLAALIQSYGDGSRGEVPTREQWLRILQREAESPFALVNLFKFHEKANYRDQEEAALTGGEAFQRYAEVSLPAMQRAGGEFLAVAPFAGSFIGADQDWELVAIGKYPNLRAFLSLYQDPDYLKAFRHRKAACLRQAVFAIEQ